MAGELFRSEALIAGWAMALAGCTLRISPAPVELRPPSERPILRIGGVKESFAGTWAPDSKANANWVHALLELLDVSGMALKGSDAWVRDEVQRLLLQSPAASMFADDPSNLTLEISILADHEDDLPHIGRTTLLSIATLGLIPLTYECDWNHQCEASVHSPNGSVVATYSFQVKGTFYTRGYPSTWVTLLAAYFHAPVSFSEINRRVANNIVAEVMKRIAADYPRLAKLRDANTQLVGAAPAMSPTAPRAAPEVFGAWQRWAVIIGVSEYKFAGAGGLTNLRYAARDAEQLYGQLVGTAPATWPKDNVRLLTNKDATERAVRDALLTFLQKAQRDDLILIFFSGHGTPDPARPRNNYFLCHDTDPSNLPATGFPMWEIDNALERGIIEAKRVVLLADACHSGGFAPEGMRDIRVVSRNVSEGFQALGKQAVCRVVTSCEPGELSQEKADWGEGHGAFAHALIQGLAGKADATAERNARGNGDGKVDLDELVYYLRRQVGDLTSNGQHVQDTGRLNAVLLQR